MLRIPLYMVRSSCTLLLCVFRGNFVRLIVISGGVQYLFSKSVVSRIIWFILVIFALAGAAYFSENIFTDWQVVVFCALVVVIIIMIIAFGRTAEL